MARYIVVLPDGEIQIHEESAIDANNFPAYTVMYDKGEQEWYMVIQLTLRRMKHEWELIETSSLSKEHQLLAVVMPP